MSDLTCHRWRTRFAALVLFTIPWVAQGCGTETVDPDTAIEDEFNCGGVACGAGQQCIDGVCTSPSGGCTDVDGDGFGDGCDRGDDCDDTRAEVNPDRAEVCDEIDNDCDFFVDEDNVCAPCTPACTPGESLCSGNDVVRCDDSDGCARFGEPEPCPSGSSCDAGSCVEDCTDADNDGAPVRCEGVQDDCDDGRGDVYPGAPEVCDGIDNNCDTRVDENFVCDGTCDDECVAGSRECTGDGSGRVSCEAGPDGCLRWSGVIACREGRACVDGSCVNEAVCIDRDGDGFGPGCDAGDDCRPLDASAHPGAAETCDGVDDDCDGVVDSGGACASCPPATAAAPAVASVTAPAYRISCGGAEYVRLDGLSAGAPASIAVVGLPGAVDAALGTLSGGTFTQIDAGLPLPGARVFSVASVPAGSVAVRVSATAGVGYGVAVGSLSGACTADGAEPNNSPGSGVPLGSQGWVGSGTLCTGDLDFVVVEAAAGDVIQARVIGETGSGQVLASIWRNGSALAPAFGGPAVGGVPTGQTTHFRADLPGEYAVGIRGFTSGVNNAWAAGVWTERSSCTDDAQERRSGQDDDTLATAQAGGTSGSITGTLCPGDFDIISVGRLTDTQELAGSFEGGGIDGVRVQVLLDDWGAPRDFPTALSATGQYYLAVFSENPSATGTYTLSWSVR